MKKPGPDQDLAAAASGLAKLISRPLRQLSAADLTLVVSMAFTVVERVAKEEERRKSLPRGAARLRLVAADGSLTEAGKRSVRARKAVAARKRNASRRKSASK